MDAGSIHEPDDVAGEGLFDRTVRLDRIVRRATLGPGRIRKENEFLVYILTDRGPSMQAARDGLDPGSVTGGRDAGAAKRISVNGELTPGSPWSITAGEEIG